MTPAAAGMFHCDGIFLVTAKALAEGEGYRITSLPEEIEQTKYPVAFPALLAAAWRLAPKFPENLLLLKLVPLGFSLAWFLAVAALLRLETGTKQTAFRIVF